MTRIIVAGLVMYWCEDLEVMEGRWPADSRRSGWGLGRHEGRGVRVGWESSGGGGSSKFEGI